MREQELSAYSLLGKEMEKIYEAGTSSRASGVICLGAGRPLEGPEVLLKYGMVQNCVFMTVVQRKPEKVKSSCTKSRHLAF